MKKKNTEDWEEIKRVYNFMCQEGLSSLDLAEEEFKIRLKRRQKEKPVLAPITPLPTKKEEKISLPTIKSPLTGIFYRAPSAKAQSFVEPGQVVEKGQTICIIEAMKVMNEILADARCRIEKIFVENGHLVLAGQEIFAISLIAP
ncbi:MAG TPA: acetyl-CoA carboxylase biotin carboxyl carrier protein [Elusimicrobia bacterium]|jgi:biotin carboxyl carrier protein|nr:acetyl-CoA carboxylase biotin carboxyl carrier protein [Elusimicrobiota bacterium]